jgi:hypothetical protein
MILVNTTFLVEYGLENEWIDWAHTVYIATATSVGHRNPLLMRVFSKEENGGTTFALQIQCDGKADADEWLTKLQPGLLKEISTRWGQRVLHFTTMMEEVERD